MKFRAIIDYFLVIFIFLNFALIIGTLSNHKIVTHNDYRPNTHFSVCFSYQQKTETDNPLIQWYDDAHPASSFFAYYIVHNPARYHWKSYQLLGIYVTAIYIGQEWVSQRKNIGWIFKRNGARPMKGVSATKVHPNDRFNWKYQ